MKRTGKFALTAALLVMILHTAGSAQNWEQMSSPVTTPLKGIWGTSSSNIYAVGSGGVILHYDGTAWSRVTGVAVTENLNAVHGSSASNIVAVGENGILVQYNGSAWTKRTVTSSQNLNAVWVVSTSRMFIAGENGLILDCDQTTCEQSTYVTSYALNSIWASSASDVYIAGGAGLIIHFDGTKWTQMQTSSSELLYSLWGASSSDIYAVGENGAVLHYNGTTWSPMRVVKRNYYAVGGIRSPFRVYVATQDGKISYYEGGAWTDMNSGTTKALQAIWVSPTNEAFIVGASGLILRYADEVMPENTEPEAAFTASVSTDDPLTVYVDASESSDIQTPSDKLRVQWDWETDGTYDTQYSTIKTASHTYPAPGVYTITVRVIDEGGLTGTASKQIVLTPGGPDQCPAQKLLQSDEQRLESLRSFRDNILCRTETGRLLVEFYYRHGDTISACLAEHPRLAALCAKVIEALLPVIEQVEELSGKSQ